MRSLAVISHTEHYYTADGLVVGWEPTVRELDHLAELFDLIYHIAPIHKGTPSKVMSSYSTDKIIHVPIKPAGGNTLGDKLLIICVMFYNIKIIINTIRKVDWIHFRAPTNLGLYVLPILSLLKNKNKWVKYAGNWIKKDIPFSYFIQRWWLQRNIQNSFVTINGKWPNQKKHLLSFTNPCLTKEELGNAFKVGNKKQFSGKLNICFVGRLDDNKGINRILYSLLNMRSIKHLGEFNIVGDGPDRLKYTNLSNKIDLNIIFHNWLNRFELNKIYARSHIIVLPTHSEGFPKVIAEASAFGCIPVVTNMSPINQFITNNKNGILINEPSIQEIIRVIKSVEGNEKKMKKISLLCFDTAKNFTFSEYIANINQKILSQ